jgi:hypothetical protein
VEIFVVFVVVVIILALIVVIIVVALVSAQLLRELQCRGRLGSSWDSRSWEGAGL